MTRRTRCARDAASAIASAAAGHPISSDASGLVKAVRTEEGVLEEVRVEGEDRSLPLGYRVHREPGTVETGGMTVQNVVTLLERKALADMEGDDFFGLSAHELRGGQTGFKRPK